MSKVGDEAIELLRHFRVRGVTPDEACAALIYAFITAALMVGASRADVLEWVAAAFDKLAGGGGPSRAT